MDIANFIVDGAARGISPVEGEMATKWPEGVVSAASTSLGQGGVGASRAATPSVAFGDISPSRGENASAIAIVAETAADIAAREALLDEAMGPKRRKKSSEKLRRGRRPSEGLAFVARDASGGVAGTVRLWDVTLGEGGPAALLLGPIAVDPSLKSAGIGSALMRHAIAEAARLGHAAILLVGDAPYYGRFGFSAARTGSLAMPGPYERHRLLALELVEGALDGVHGTLKGAGRKLKAQELNSAA
jgi:predicted N-acetyltransferase YhbS